MNRGEDVCVCVLRYGFVFMFFCVVFGVGYISALHWGQFLFHFHFIFIGACVLDGFRVNERELYE